jgi:metacaspase-1
MKRAILFGLNYRGQEGELRGCVNDAKHMQRFLASKGYTTQLMTSDAATSRRSIVRRMFQLAVSSWRSNLTDACIYYSGHGGNVRRGAWNKRQEVEVDGKDEFLVPTDCRRRGVVYDDTIKRILRLFNPRTRVLVVVDACHSGTMCDLKYSYDGHQSVSTVPHSRCRANIVCVSGCRDEQYSFETLQRGQVRGLLTTALLRALERTCVVCEVRELVLQYVRASKLGQDPQVSSSFRVQRHHRLLA